MTNNNTDLIAKAHKKKQGKSMTKKDLSNSLSSVADSPGDSKDSEKYSSQQCSAQQCISQQCTTGLHSGQDSVPRIDGGC